MSAAARIHQLSRAALRKRNDNNLIACEYKALTCGGLACSGAETKLALVQRSCGYALRPTLTIADIGRVVQIVKAQSPNCVVAVDNCYGEFTEEQEPCAVGCCLSNDGSGVCCCWPRQPVHNTMEQGLSKQISCW